MTNEPTTHDVVVVGAGLGGLATALGAAVQGLSVLVLEAGDKVGGAASYSGGQVWAAANHVAEREGITGDSLELGERYIRAIAHDHPELLDERAMRRWLGAGPAALRWWEDLGAVTWSVIPGLADYHNEADGCRPAGRYLTAEYDGARLGEWRDRLLVTPYFPVGTTYRDLLARGRRMQGLGETDGAGEGARPEVTEDLLTFGTGVVAGFLARVLQEPAVRIETGRRVTDLLTDEAGAVVGVRARGRHEEDRSEHRGRVVLATSGYDWDRELVEELVGLGPEEWGSVAPRTVRGDGIRLARSVGGAVVRMPASAVTMQPGWASTFAEGFSYGPDTAMPHTMIVDANGRRFCDDSYWVDIAHKAMDPEDPHRPFFLIFDEQHHRKYGLGPTPPGGAYPEGLVTSANTLAELGELLGIEPLELQRTADRFGDFARRGEDDDFGRGTREYVRRFYGDPDHGPSPVLGTIEEPPFHGIRLRFVAAAVGNSGVHTDAEGRVLDEAGTPVPGLHAVGSVAALTPSGTGYNSGIALGRALTLAYLVSHELAGVVAPVEKLP